MLFRLLTGQIVFKCNLIKYLYTYSIIINHVFADRNTELEDEELNVLNSNHVPDNTPTNDYNFKENNSDKQLTLMKYYNELFICSDMALSTS